MYTNDEIMRIIAATLKGYANSQELELLRSWLKEDPANREKYEMMEKIWQESGFVLSTPAFDVRKGWERLHGTIQVAEAQKRTFRQQSRPVFIRRQLAIAATLLAAALIGWYLWNTQRTHLETFTASSGNQSITLPDKSVVWVRKGSSLRYPSSFNKSDRTVYLAGEAYFEVTHRADQPFTVSTDRAGINVLGTSFLVNSEPSGDKIVVVTGRVNVTDKQKAGNEMVLTAGQQVILSGNQFLQAAVTDSNFMAWKTGILNFKDAPLDQVLNDIAHFYGVMIKFSNNDQAAAAAIPVTARFQDQSLDQVLDELKLTTGWSVKNDGEFIIFSKR